MLKLFKVMDDNRPAYFEAKRDAKVKRDAMLNNGRSAVVSRGPDHWRGESFNISKQTPGAGRRW